MENIETTVGYDSPFRYQVVCPVCTGEYDKKYVHFNAPKGDAVSDDNHSEWEGRGGCIRIPMYCESGHIWEMCVGFHKGETFIFNDKIGNNTTYI